MLTYLKSSGTRFCVTTFSCAYLLTLSNSVMGDAESSATARADGEKRRELGAFVPEIELNLNHSLHCPRPTSLCTLKHEKKKNLKCAENPAERIDKLKKLTDP